MEKPTDIATFQNIISNLSKVKKADHKEIQRVLSRNPKSNGQLFAKSELIEMIIKNKDTLGLSLMQTQHLLSIFQMKNIRTLSGVTPVTLLTKPFPCPGKCIFCPNDVRMPKSYISDEPGAQRAYTNHFDPYYQTFNRLAAYNAIGHPTDKIEIIILGGTWTVYSENYQIWFIKRCFDALNDFGKTPTPLTLIPSEEMPIDETLLQEIKGASLEKSYNQVIAKGLSTKLSNAKKETATWDELFEVQKQNELSKTRCIGLSIETRPDEIDANEIVRIRKLGATKVQIGIQSLNDKVLKINKRGHGVKQTRDALNMLRQAGFKIHAHWMPNLYGSTPKKDMHDFKKLFNDSSIKPDELKVYPCSLIESAELMQYYNTGKWKPYNKEDLQKVLEFVFLNTPRYCRLTRVIRDIPSTDIVVGNKLTNFRQIVENSLKLKHSKMMDIRAREIKGELVAQSDLKMKITKYSTKVSKEFFIEYVTPEDKIAGFVRLSLPTRQNFIEELKKAAIIREVHVYGQSIEIDKTDDSAAQHKGLGKTLIAKSIEIAKKHRFKKICVISSIGTREYYKKLGFELEDLYQALAI